jgi:DNA polymerase III sliding clamp (beta) subunit (PCNA family)
VKFKLNKSDHLSFFGLLNKFEKTKINVKENSLSGNDSLIFYSFNNKFNVFVNTIFCQSNWKIMDTEEEFCFALDSYTFYNAFNNFPADEVQFVYNSEDNSLIFGNKKTRVALKTTPCSTPEEMKFKDLKNLNTDKFLEAIRYSSFSCSNEADEYPYNSINVSFGNIVNAQSSDKHRISLFGDVDFDNSYVISKSSADISTLFINTLGNVQYSINSNKLNLLWGDIYLIVSLGSKADTGVFKTLKNFKTAKELDQTMINKSELAQSVKFISGITNSIKTEFVFDGDKLTLSSQNNEKGAVVDTLNLKKPVKSITVSYLSSHLLKILDILPEKDLTITLLDFNSFVLMSLTSGEFTHILFPME